MKKKFNKRKDPASRDAAGPPAAPRPGTRDAAPPPAAAAERPRDVLHDAARKAGIFLPGGNRRR